MEQPPNKSRWQCAVLRCSIVSNRVCMIARLANRALAIS